MSMEEALEKFEMRYRTVLENTGGSAEYRKTCAWNEAQVALPNAADYLSAYRVALTTGKKKKELTDDEYVGFRMLHIMMNASKQVIGMNRRRVPNNPVVAFVQEEKQEEKVEAVVAIAQSYYWWVEKYLWIPDDQVLAHFTGKSSQAFVGARSRMKKEGWVFEKRSNLWWVKTKGESLVEEAKSETLDADTLAKAIVELRRQGLI